MFALQSVSMVKIAGPDISLTRALEECRNLKRWALEAGIMGECGA